MEHPKVYIPDRLVKIENLENGSRKVSNTRYNHILFITNVKKSELSINMNQKIKKVVYNNCEDCQLQTLDSAVIGSRTAEFINVKNCTILFDEVDVRVLRFYNCEGITIQFSDSETLIENFRLYWKNCKDNKVQRTVIRRGTDPNKHRILPVDLIKSFNVPDTQGDEILVSFLEEGKELRTAQLEDKQNPSYERTAETVLEEMRVAEENNAVFDDFPDKKLGELYEKEIEEFEDPPHVFQEKVKQIADALRASKHTVVYTGAGISTAASLPDYRGPNGVWTMRSKGAAVFGKVELGDAKPTYAHYALMELMRKDIVKFISSTNLDGLHRKSGVPANKISEMHGNCYREICGDCEREYLRSFDTLTSREDRWSHFTGRYCACGGKLKDTIVHFTETVPPREWDPAVKNARISDVALVMGTSMNVQPAASLPDKALVNGGKLFIVNLQRTPYDEFATIKVHAKTDDFMFALMTELSMTEFDTTYDAVEEMAAREEREEQIKFLIKAAGVALLAAAGAFAAFRFYKLRK